MPRHNWTVEDESFLIENYSSMTRSKIAKHLGLRANQVSSKLNKMRVSSHAKQPHPEFEQITPWTARLMDIFPIADILEAEGRCVQCRSRYQGKVELKAYFVQKEA